MAVHYAVPPHPAALFVANKLGADIGSVIVYGLAGRTDGLIGRRPAVLKFLGNRLPFKPVPMVILKCAPKTPCRWAQRCLPFCCRLA